MANKMTIRTRRIFSEEFKRRIVQQIVEKRVSIPDVVEVHGVARTSIYRWIYRYSAHHQSGTTVVVQMDSEETKVKRLQAQLAQAEQKIGRQAIELDYLGQLIVVASEALKVDIKKNFSSQPSNGSASAGVKGAAQ